MTSPHDVAVDLLSLEEVYLQIFKNVCPLDYTAVAGNGNVRSVNQVNNSSWVNVSTLNWPS